MLPDGGLAACRAVGDRVNASGPAPQAEALFPDAQTRHRIDALLGQRLAQARARRPAEPVAPQATFADFSAELRRFDFEHPQPLDDVLDWTLKNMESGIVQIAHPRYFGLFNPAPTFPAECADRIAASFNPQLATATTSPFPVALEAHVIRQLARRAGFSGSCTGHFTSGGSEANFTALVCALTRLHPDFATLGARALPGPPRVYVSQDAHLAWLKIAHQSGIGRNAVRLVATDGNGRMDAASLQSAIDADLAAGAVPAVIVATIGTTGAGMIDPLAACGVAATRCGAWLHADAAWAGAAMVSDRLRPHLHGIETADSATIDAHKWFATTMGCGIFLTSHPDLLRRAFAVDMPCMPSCNASVDPYVGSAQWSRRFLGLRLFLALSSAGWGGYSLHVEKAAHLAEYLASRLRALGWRRLNDSPFAVLCMVPPDGDPAVIASRVVQSGMAWVSTVPFEGEAALRFCITSGETTERDVDLLVGALSAG